MTTFQHPMGNRKQQPPRATSAGTVMVARARYVFNPVGIVAAADRIEMMVLPAFNRVCDLILVGATGIVCTANVGFMSGDVGDPSDLRTVGSQFFSAADVNAAVTRASLATAFTQAATDADRSIGMTFSANIGANAGRSVELIMFYAP